MTDVYAPFRLVIVGRIIVNRAEQFDNAYLLAPLNVFRESPP